MKKLMNTLYVTSEDCYARLEGENVLLQREDAIVARFPLHALESIVLFSYRGASPQLMGACAERGVGLSFFTPRGRFLAEVTGESCGNVLLRKKQYRVSDNAGASCLIARHMLLGKIYNSRAVLERALRDHPQRSDEGRISAAIQALKEALAQMETAEDPEVLRGIEGKAAAAYFGAMDELILQQKEVFYFNTRTRRPPMDAMNALLSFAYALLCRNCRDALCSVGLDPFVGFLHRDRPGRVSLALDLMEELRSVMADRFVLTMINNRVIRDKHFQYMENGACLLDDDGRKLFLKHWQERKQESLTHPFLKEKITWGLVPFVQAMLLARTLRGDHDGYPPFFWK